MKFYQYLKSRYTRSESGATAIEYAIIASGISILIIVAVYALGGDLSALFSSFTGIFTP